MEQKELIAPAAQHRHLPLLCKVLLVMSLFAFVLDNLLLGGIPPPQSFIAEAPNYPNKAAWFAHTPNASKFVPLADRLQLSLLHQACLSNRETIITWKYGVDGEENTDVLLKRGDPRVLDELRQCPDIDIYLPAGIRGAGYCEDGCAYTKYLSSRLLPAWVFDDHFFDASLNQTVWYHELCPKTPLLFMNHYWDGKPDAKDWPTDKPIYLMPNIEMGQLQAAAYWRADVVLCKTKGCYNRVTKWYEQEGNPRGTAVFYTRHTTSDVASYARHVLGKENIRPKDFSEVTFTHTAGGSVHKGTPSVIECWLSRPDFPSLNLYMSQGLYDSYHGGHYGPQINASGNIHLVLDGLNNVNFGRMMAESSFFLCPSTIEGYGHYINQARSSGGVIITTDAHPMNELIPVPDGGIYVTTKRSTHPDMMLGGGYMGEHGLRGFEDDGLIANIAVPDLCEAVSTVLNMSTEQRRSMAERAQLQYHEDTKVFARAMRELRAYAREQEKLNARDAMTGILETRDRKSVV